MAKLISYRDGQGSPYAKVRLDDTTPLFIYVSHRRASLRRSRFGLFGKTLYEESPPNFAAAVEKANAWIREYTIPDDIKRPLFRALVQIAMQSGSEQQLTANLEAAFGG